MTPEPEAPVVGSEGFVTVGQAAKLLGVSDRTARRMAGQLADSDRTESNGHGRRVRLAAMQSLRSEALHQRGNVSSGFHVETSDGHEADTVAGQWPDSDRPPAKATRTDGRTSDRPDTATLTELAALRAEKEGLIARLADTASDRDAWKEQAGKLDSRLAEALEALQRAQDEARAARLIGQRPVQQIEALGTPDGSQNSSEGVEHAKSPLGTVKAPWWAFWKTRG